MITSFSIWKIEYKDGEKKEKSPDYRLTTKAGEEWVEIGAAWKKTTTDGKPYISCKLATPYKEKSGYQITEDKPDIRVQEEDRGIRAEEITFEDPLL